ncbi:1-deoxy-D-xylulose-5-phosphate reductoisomerase [Oscillibacter sp. MSJ-2]|uniref:1-deoxy-D-xylulose 5-phosphate reductoisomerase n=1 Tax=Dysosmobacter acutus TaxID=2841504 RepID=A0ABS6FA10_9FIRM|nr:1-deoxy-D-xylulose-5-phosphate reductoisomerase [Dysosmobacter acutus]MBU5627137.1 1-deoxy-D-xylulose-5-phosphate reductoisomerase [Dysosmobacter acutus]
MSKVISVLGSTGSIGRQTLDVAGQLGLKVAALTTNRNIALLEQQTRRFRPRLAVVYEEAAAEQFRGRVKDLEVKVLSGMEGLLEAASIKEADTVVTAVVGMVGLRPTLAAIEQGKRIAFANKETLVCAGELVMDAADRHGAEVVPVDSEHSAIFQCLQGCRDRRELRRLILTCSGGPFYGKKSEELKHMTSKDALHHPNWKMGPKITVDCATLMNKGLEVIEAMRLYRLPLSQVDVVIHRQSIVHSLVEYRDGAVLAQLGTPDMRLPIRYALTYPCRGENPEPPLDLLSCPPLTFAAPDLESFPCLRLAMEAAQEGGTACAVLNGANEEAVGLFLKGEIGFTEIPELVESARRRVLVKWNASLEDILEADRCARAAVLGRQ